MDGAASKALVERYFAALRAGDPALPELLSDDVTWWVPESSPLGGIHQGKDAVLALMGSGTDLYDASVPLEITIQSLIAEASRVAVQLVIDARTAKGEPYRNHYHFAFEVRGGRIHAVREYLDTLYAEQKLFS
jgi:hypothetical protein